LMIHNDPAEFYIIILIWVVLMNTLILVKMILKTLQ